MYDKADTGNIYSILMIALSWMTLLPQQHNSHSCIRKIVTSPVKLSAQLLLFLVLSNITALAEVYGQDRSEVELLNFVFANYLGSGFYSSSGGQVFILNIPLATTLRTMTDDEAGWIVKYPVTFGVSNIDQIGEGEIPDVNDVGTVSVTPGIEYLYPVLPNWHLVPFFDLGIARDLANESSTRVLGTGIKSFVEFDIAGKSLTLGNRFLFADQENFDHGSHSNFSVFETGLDYIIPTDLSIDGSVIDLGLYFINYTYLDDLVLVDYLDERISLENKNEIGFTVSLPKYSWLPDNARVGIGVQMTQDKELYRLVLGSPFF